MTLATIQSILFNYSDEVAQVVAGADLANFDELFEELFEYYCETAEIPYGVATAKTGDPYEWITEKLIEATAKRTLH